jgi:hypothetical protein
MIQKKKIEQMEHLKNQQNNHIFKENKEEKVLSTPVLSLLSCSEDVTTTISPNDNNNQIDEIYLLQEESVLKEFTNYLKTVFELLNQSNKI